MEKAKKSQREDFPEGITECGADALRFGLLAYTTQGRDVNLDIKRVVGYRQFCNKLWNAVRFALAYVADYQPQPSSHLEIHGAAGVSLRDLYILSLLNTTIKDVNRLFTDYQFGAATSALHSFFLYEVCDVYLELLKPVFTDMSESNLDRRRCAQATLYTVLEQYLRLTHPLMPFVTEELWQRLPNRTSLTSIPSIIIAPYPEELPAWHRPDVEANMQLVKSAIDGARSLRAEYKVANHVKVEFYFRTESSAIKAALLAQEDDFCTLAKASFLRALAADDEAPKSCSLVVLSDQLSLLVNLSGIIDIENEILRLTKEFDRLSPSIEVYRRKLAMPGNDKVPETVKQANIEKLAAMEVEIEAITKAIEAYKLMK